MGVSPDDVGGLDSNPWSRGMIPCLRRGRRYLLHGGPQEHNLIWTDCSTTTERSENDRPVARAETEPGLQRWFGGRGRHAPEAAGAPGCLDGADLRRMWLATARTVLCQLT